MAYRFLRYTTVALGAALLVSGCTTNKQETPPLAGPSELSTAINISVSPDVLVQDGASQSLVTVMARDQNGQPLRSLPLRAEIAVNGFIADFGSLSARSLVTDANGRATVTYTAPPAPAFSIDAGTTVEIRVTPVGTDFGNASPRFATIRLTPPGIIVPPTNGLTPKFVFSPPAPVDHQTVIFDASGSTTTNASIVSYRWNFGDGDSGSGITAQHDYDDPGTFIATLTITDSIGRVNSVSQSITVGAGTPPGATIVVSPSAPVVGQSVNFNGGTSRPAAGRTIRSYDWDFGDGRTGSGVQTSHVYTAAGSYTVLLTVTDDAGRIATATVGVTVGTGLPTADFTFSPGTGTTSTPINFDGGGSQAATGRTIVSYAWAFGDGGTGSGMTTSHRFSSAGTYTVRLTVTDDQGKTNFTTKSVTIN